MARTMYRVRKGDFQCFLPNETLARVARRTFPELKGGRILNVSFSFPGSIIPGRLIEGQGSAQMYRPDKANLQARCVGL
jgi:hypothetical protein